MDKVVYDKLKKEQDLFLKECHKERLDLPLKEQIRLGDSLTISGIYMDSDFAEATMFGLNSAIAFEVLSNNILYNIIFIIRKARNGLFKF